MPTVYKTPRMKNGKLTISKDAFKAKYDQERLEELLKATNKPVGNSNIT
jgi:hypothetical protein